MVDWTPVAVAVARAEIEVVCSAALVEGREVYLKTCWISCGVSHHAVGVVIVEPVFVLGEAFGIRYRIEMLCEYRSPRAVAGTDTVVEPMKTFPESVKVYGVGVLAIIQVAFGSGGILIVDPVFKSYGIDVSDEVEDHFPIDASPFVTAIAKTAVEIVGAFWQGGNVEFQMVASYRHVSGCLGVIIAVKPILVGYRA